MRLAMWAYHKLKMLWPIWVFWHWYSKYYLMPILGNCLCWSFKHAGLLLTHFVHAWVPLGPAVTAYIHTYNGRCRLNGPLLYSPSKLNEHPGFDRRHEGDSVALMLSLGTDEREIKHWQQSSTILLYTAPCGCAHAFLHVCVHACTARARGGCLHEEA